MPSASDVIDFFRTLDPGCISLFVLALALWLLIAIIDLRRRH
jgi:hypothetical protein